ncbi:MAG: AAA family ATPase [Bacillota bacterium]
MGVKFATKTIAVYSVNKKVGKSTVARELAGSYQVGGKKTLLVDLTLGRGGVLKSMLAPDGRPDLSHWVEDIVRRLKKKPWHEITYTPEVVSQYVFTHESGLSILSCNIIDVPEQMMDVTAVILYSLAGCRYDVIVFDLMSAVRDYVIRVLSSVETVLLVADTYRYDVKEVQLVMERLEEANCRTDHFKVVFNKKPDFFDDSPLQLAEEFKMPMIGSLPDFPGLGEDIKYNFDKENEYSAAMRDLIKKI